MSVRWKIIAGLVALVLVSMLAGGFIGSGWTRMAQRKRGLPEAWNVNAMRTLNRRLHLSAEQSKATQAILDSHIEELRSIRDRTAQETMSVLDRAVTQIDGLLTAEQRKEFARMKPQRDQALDALRLSPAPSPAVSTPKPSAP